MISPEEVEETIEFSAVIENRSSIIFPISYDVVDIQTEAYWNGNPITLTVNLEKIRGMNYIVLIAENLPDEKGIINVKLSFRTKGMIEKASDKYLFSQSFSVPYDVNDMTITVILPSKFSILSPIFPSPKSISAAGKEVIVIWSYGPIRAGQENFLILGFRENYGRFFWIPYAITSLIFAFTAGLLIGRKISRPSRYVALADEEKVLQVLRDRRSVTQAELVQILGFSKAKLSKLLSQMEKEGLIRREKFKKTFIITIAEKRSTSASER